MIVEILFFILIILIVILFLCVKKVYTGGFLPRSAELPVDDPDDNSIVFFEMSSMTDINKYIDIVTYKNLIKDYETLDKNYENDRLKDGIVSVNNNRQYITIRDWFTIGDDFEYKCHDDFKWGNSAFSFICGKSRTDYVGSVKQNLKEIINNYVELEVKINTDIHIIPCVDGVDGCIYCLTKNTKERYLIYLYDAYRNSNIYPNLIKIIKDEFTKLQKYIHDTLFDVAKCNLITVGSNTFAVHINILTGGKINTRDSNACVGLSIIIIIFYLCNEDEYNEYKFNNYYDFLSKYTDNLQEHKDTYQDKYKKLFKSIKVYFTLKKYETLQLTPYEKIINDIIDKRDGIVKANNNIDKYYNIINKISVIICYRLHILNVSSTLLNIIDVNENQVPEKEPNNEPAVDDKKKYENEYIHKYIMYILFLIAKNTLKDDILAIGDIGDIAANKSLNNVIGDSPGRDDVRNSNNNYLYKNNILNVNSGIKTNPTNKYLVISNTDDCIWKGHGKNPLPFGDNGRGRGRGRGYGYGRRQGQNLGPSNDNCDINGMGTYRRVLYPPPTPPLPPPLCTCALILDEQTDLNKFIKKHAIKIAKILHPHINRAIKYFEADDRLILLKGTLANPEYGFHVIQKAYYETNINTFYFMRQTLIIYPESFFGTEEKLVENDGEYEINCSSYDRYRVNHELKSTRYPLEIYYYTNTDNDKTENNVRKFDLNLITEDPVNSNIMTLPFIPIIFNDIDADVVLVNEDRKYLIDNYIGMKSPLLGSTITNIIKFICEHNIRFVLYNGSNGKFNLPKRIQENMIKIFKHNLEKNPKEELLQENLDKYMKYCNRIFSIIPRFFSAITKNTYYVDNENSTTIIGNFINSDQNGNVEINNNNIKIVDSEKTTNNADIITITMNISGIPENFTFEKYKDLLSEDIYDKLPSSYLVVPHNFGVNNMRYTKLKVTKEDNGTITEKFAYIGTNMPSDDEIIERKKREPKQIYGGPQTSEFSLLAQIPQQKSTPMEYSLYYSTEEYKESEKDFSYSVQEFNLSSSSEYISSPATNESEYAICYTNNDYSSEKEMQSLCDSTGILYSTKLFTVESSEPVDNYERIRISQELHKLDNNIPEIKMPKDLKILKHDISKKNKIRIKKVIRGLNGKVLSIDDVHTIYINIE